MKKLTTRLSLFLAVLMLLLSFVACGPGATDGGNGNDNKDPVTPPPPETEETVEVTNAPKSDVKAGETLKMSFDFPEGMNLTKYAIQSSNPNLVKVKGDKLIFIDKGSAEITVKNKKDDKDATKFNVNVAPKEASHINFDLNSEFVKDNFTPYYYTTTSNGKEVPFDRNWKIEDGILKVVMDEGATIQDIDKIYALYLKNRTFENYEITFNYYNQETFETGSQGGWITIMSGKTDRTKTCKAAKPGDPNVDGDFISVTGNGNSTLWGQNVGHHTAPGNKVPTNYYRDNEWHLVRFKVYANTIEIFVDDLQTPSLRKTVEGEFPGAGEIALMSNASSSAQMKNIGINILDENGKKAEYAVPDAISIKNKDAFKDVSLTTEAIQLDLSTKEAFSVTSSDPKTVAVSESGLVSFLAAGKATITVRCNDNPSVVDTLDITVQESADVLTIQNKTANAKLGTAYTPQVKGAGNADLDWKDLTLKVTTTDGKETDAVMIRNNSLLLLKPGKVTVSVFKTATPAIGDQFDMTIDPIGTIDYSKETFKSEFAAYYCQKKGNNPAVAPALKAFDDIFNWKEDGSFEKKAPAGPIADDWNMLLFKNGENLAKAQYVEITVNIKVAPANMARTGIVFGYTDVSKDPQVAGDLAFITKARVTPQAKVATPCMHVVGQNSGDYKKAGVDPFDQGVWHLMRVKVYQNTVEVYMDDMTTPIQTVTVEKDWAIGAFGLVASKGVSQFANASYAELNADGTYKK